MPYSSELIDGGRGMLHVGRGVLTGAEVIAGAIADHEPPGRAARLTHGFVDLVEVTRFSITPQEVRRVVSENRVTATQTKHATVAVVAPLDHPFGMARMWEALAHETGWTTRVFRVRAEALEWLTAELGRDPGVPRAPQGSRG